MPATLNVITWEEFQIGIAPLWNSSDPYSIPIFNNPYGIIQYHKSLWKDIIYFPCEYKINDKVVGYISIYNLSDIHIRPRGIYIKPEYRGRAHGHQMQVAAWNLFPKSFYRAFIWSRAGNVDRFCKHSKMNVVPGGSNVWSEFGKDFQFFLHNDRGPYPTQDQIESNKDFLEDNKTKFSLGGTNNLNVNWNDTEWQSYFETHQGNYQQLDIQLDF